MSNVKNQSDNDSELLLDESFPEGEFFTDVEIASKLIRLKGRAAKRNIHFDMSFNRIKQLIRTKTCYYTGMKFVNGNEQLCRSIDRVDNSVGYVDSNVVVCTRLLNSKKGSLSKTELLKLVAGIDRFEKSKQSKAKSARTKK